MADQQNYIVTGLNYIVTILQSIIQMVYLLLTKEYGIFNHSNYWCIYL